MEIKQGRNKMMQTYTNNKRNAIICPNCNVPMLQHQSYGGGIYWFCGTCGCKVERTGL